LLGKRRTSYEFIVQMVKACLRPIGKTELYYIIKTRHTDFERWLDKAIGFRLIENVDNKLRATEKGINFLNAWAEVQTFLRKNMPLES